MSKARQRPITKARYIAAVNEWWRLFRDEPERFQQQFQVVLELNAAEAEGREPTIGENDWKFLNHLLEKLAKKEQRAKRSSKSKRSTKPKRK